jgi:hypothetical protein
MNWKNGFTKFPKFIVGALGITCKLLVAVAAIAVFQSYYALDVRFSLVRPIIAVQWSELDSVSHFSLSDLLNFGGNNHCPHSPN